MQLAELVETSAALVATPSRNAKIAIVAQALRAAGGSETGASEVGVVAAYLSNVLPQRRLGAVSYTHLRAHETVLDLVCRLLLEKKKVK